MTFADIVAIAANLAFLLLILPVWLVLKEKKVRLLFIISFGAVLLFTEFYGDATLVEISRGILGDLSISGLLFLLVVAVVYFTELPLKLFDRSFCMIIVVMGLVLYLSEIDIIPLDIYKFGYDPQVMLVLVFLLSMLFWSINTSFAIIWLVALITFVAELQNSINLWDYLIDPVLWIVCLYKLILPAKEYDKLVT